MKGIQYLINDHGEKQAVLIDLQHHKELWEDFYDAAVAAERESEPRESFDEVSQKSFNADLR